MNLTKEQIQTANLTQKRIMIQQYRNTLSNELRLAFDLGWRPDFLLPNKNIKMRPPEFFINSATETMKKHYGIK